MTLKELEEQILIAPHPEMEPHVKRGAFFLVDPELDLAAVALAMSQNDEAKVSDWINANKITRPGPEEINVWRQYKTFFKFIIVQPFVMAQKHTDLNIAKG